MMTKEPVTKVECLKGSKLRSPSRTGVWTLEALGVAAIGAPLPQIPTMIAKGTVSGALLPYEIAPAVRMQDLANYFTDLAPPQPRIASTIFAFLMNKKSYEGLPPDLKKVIDNNSGRKLAPFAAKVWDDIEAKGLKVVRSKKKNKFRTLSAAETATFRATVQPVIERYKAEMKRLGYDGDQLLADTNAIIAKYEKK